MGLVLIGLVLMALVLIGELKTGLIIKSNQSKVSQMYEIFYTISELILLKLPVEMYNLSFQNETYQY